MITKELREFIDLLQGLDTVDFEWLEEFVREPRKVSMSQVPMPLETKDLVGYINSEWQPTWKGAVLCRVAAIVREADIYLHAVMLQNKLLELAAQLSKVHALMGKTHPHFSLAEEARLAEQALSEAVSKLCTEVTKS